MLLLSHFLFILGPLVSRGLFIPYHKIEVPINGVQVLYLCIGSTNNLYGASITWHKLLGMEHIGFR